MITICNRWRIAWLLFKLVPPHNLWMSSRDASKRAPQLRLVANTVFHGGTWVQNMFKGGIVKEEL